MIVTVQIGADVCEELTNGLNLVIYRVNNESDCTISLVDDGDKPILNYTFEIGYLELKKAIEKLEFIK